MTGQWFSVRRRKSAGTDWRQLSLADVVLLGQGRHRKKLRRGAHSGNRFEIVLRNIRALEGNLEDRLNLIAAAGVPNYFGEQRFGRDGGNLQLARDAFSGRRLRRQSRSLALSAARALLFNNVLDARLLDGSWNVLQPGDCASLDGSNSVFRVDEVDSRLSER